MWEEYLLPSCICSCVFWRPMPHENLFGIQWISNPSTETQRKSTPALSNWRKSKSNWVMSSWYKSCVRGRKSVCGVEYPHARSFLGRHITSGALIPCIGRQKNRFWVPIYERVLWRKYDWLWKEKNVCCHHIFALVFSDALCTWRGREECVLGCEVCDGSLLPP